MVGRTPWSAVDALVGLPQGRKRPILRAKNGTRASRADQGVRPTNPAAFHLLGLTKWHSPGFAGPLSSASPGTGNLRDAGSVERFELTLLKEQHDSLGTWSGSRSSAIALVRSEEH